MNESYGEHVDLEELRVLAKRNGGGLITSVVRLAKESALLFCQLGGTRDEPRKGLTLHIFFNCLKTCPCEYSI